MDEPVDVYSGWIDACEEVNKQKKLQALKQRERGTASRGDSRSPPPQNRLDPFDEDDDDY